MTALPALLIAFALAFTGAVAQAAAPPSRAPARAAKPAAVPPAPDVRRMTPRERRCYGRIHQPAASVLLNRTVVPRAICVQSCEAKLIAPRREGGRIAALTLFTGRACRLPEAKRRAGTGKANTEIARARPAPVPTR